MKWTMLLAVAGGGALGAVLRWSVAGAVQRTGGVGFPWGTLAVNLIGCFCIGLASVWFDRTAPAPALRGLVLVGGLGAFTTFSTFGLDAFGLLRDGETLRAGVYVVGSNLAGLALVAVGIVAGRALFGTA